MAKYPAPTSKVLNASGHVGMKEQMAHASVPHTSFQESGAGGTRTVAETTHGGEGMKNGGVVAAQVGNPASGGAMKGGGGNPFAQRSAQRAPTNVGNMADPSEPDADDGKKRKFGGFGKK